MIIPPGWDRLGFTSGRRTYLGNRRVGGVANSDHLDGRAADFTASPASLRAHFGPNVNILDEGDHRHVSGLSDVPFHGNRGTAGLVNGVDTSAPKGQSMFAAKRRQPQEPLYNAPLGTEPQQMMPSEPVSVPMDMNALARLANPQKVKPGLFGQGGTGRRVVGIIGDALMAAGGGQPIYGPEMMQRARIEDERNFARERLQAEIEARMQLAKQKAAEPPQFAQDAAWFTRQPREIQQQVLDARNALFPVMADVQDDQGRTFRQPMPRQLSGPPPEAIEELRADPSAAEEFDAIFGPGAARRALGN